MSFEQWGVLAFVILLPLLQGLAWLRRVRVSSEARASDRAATIRSAAPRGSPLPYRKVSDTAMGVAAAAIGSPPVLQLPLPEPRSDAAVSRPTLGASRRRVFKTSRPVETPRPLSGDTMVQWLRSTRNLRRAMVAATILGPPAH
jgi:hypothetical protein